MSQPSKKFKSDRSNDLELASVLNTPSSTPIFRLNVDCCEEIFNLLPLKDLVAVGQTCKRMQSIAGYCFQENYSHGDVIYENDGIYYLGVKINCFTRFTRNICILHCDCLKPFHYIKSNTFDSLKQLYLFYTELIDEKIDCMKKVSSKVERLAFFDCQLDGDFYEKILKFCENLRELCVVRGGWGERYLIGTSNHWLTRKYQKLEHIRLHSVGDKGINEWKTFLENHSRIQLMSINGDFLMKNQNSFLEANLKLETLIIDVRNDEDRLKLIYDILNKLRKKGSFKKLGFLMNSVDKMLFKEVDLLPIIEKLFVRDIGNTIGWNQLTGLKALQLEYLYQEYSAAVETMARSLVNLEKITLNRNICFDHILSFVRYSPNITRISVNSLKHNIDVHKLIIERKKLAEARKVVIFVPERVYLESKWSGNDADMDLVQIKRNNSNLMFHEETI